MPKFAQNPKISALTAFIRFLVCSHGFLCEVNQKTSDKKRLVT